MKMKWKTKKILAMFLCILMITNIVIPTLATVTATDGNATPNQETQHIVLNTEPETSAQNSIEATESEISAQDPTEAAEPETSAQDPTESSEAETNVASPSNPTNKVCVECGESEGHAEDCSQYKAEIPKVNLFERLNSSLSLEEFREVMLAENNREDVLALTIDEIESLMEHIEKLYVAIDEPEDDETYTYEELLETLTYLPAMECPECGEFGGHADNCTKNTEILLPGNYIYFDLSFGNVDINQDTYTGFGPDGKLNTGTHANGNKYYIFQGDGKTKYTTSLPAYSNVTYKGTDWGKYVTNHPSKTTAGDDSVDEVIAAWDAADKGGRKVTSNRVTVKTTENDTTFNITIDNLWSNYQAKSSSKNTGLSFQALGTTLRGTDTDTYTDCPTDVTVNLIVKGDNRFDRLHCATEDGQNNNYNSDTNHTNILNISGDTDATLTLANISENASNAHTSALIGGTDRLDHSFRMTFDDITVYAGGGRLDFGTAIGGGGNGPGRITINGGRITAVNSATGTAIGGGCGTTGPGGYGEVNINGGKVYAYNYTPHYTSEDSTAYTDAMPTAIGGGSSGTQIGGTGIVKITGGDIYAYSEVGNAIGGGGGGNGRHNTYQNGAYANTYGGTADVMISGDAEVDAISGKGCAIGGGPGGGRLYKDYADANDGQLPTAGAGSGPMGNAVNADGGTAKLIISGNPIIRSGSIGGGSPLDQNRVYGSTVGAAVVNISGGTIHGQVVMDGVIKNVPEEIDLINGESSSFTMTGGLIDNTPIGSKYHFVEENGGAVYIHSGTANMSGGTIQDASAPLGGAIYVKGGDFTMSGTGLIQSCHATVKVEENNTNFGGAVYVEGGNVNIEGGMIKNCYANLGGAVYVTENSEGGGNFKMTGGTIDGGTIQENATYGGAVYVDGGNFTMESGTLTNNAVPNNGGAVYITGGNVIIGKSDCVDDNHVHPVLSKNTAEYGGAIAVSGSNPVIHCCQMTGNIATENGGAVYVAGGSLTMNNGTIGGTDIGNANIAKNGGAIYVTGGSFAMSNGFIINNTASNNGGALYVASGNVTIYHGSLNSNEAVCGGAVYLAGDTNTELTMESGQMNENSASQSGGAIYATSGTLYIGLDDCKNTVITNETCTHHTELGAGRYHPQIQNNEAGISGGGIAISKENGSNGGVVHFYCGAATNNTNLNNDKGLGKNVFMDGGEFHFYDGTNVGIPRDPDLVIVGGKLWNECIDEKWITLKYYETNNAIESSMEGMAAEEEVMNLPNAEFFFETPDGKHFAGWTARGAESGDGSKFVRNKGQYIPSGDPVEIVDAEKDSQGNSSPVWDGNSEDRTIHLYALWVDAAYDITYVNILNYNEETNTLQKYQVTTQNVTTNIPAIEKAGYVLTGWYIYQDPGQNANWGYEPEYLNPNSTTYSNLDFAALKANSQYLAVSDNGTLALPTGNNSFGDITLIADYELAYSDLTIQKNGANSIDENQAFIFSIKNQELSADRNEVINPEKVKELNLAKKAVKEALNVTIVGDDSIVIKHLPLGTYIVTEDNKWCWRYGTTSSKPANGQVTLGLNDPKAVIFTNTRTNTKWLSGDSYCENWWGGASGVVKRDARNLLISN